MMAIWSGNRFFRSAISPGVGTFDRPTVSAEVNHAPGADYQPDLGLRPVRSGNPRSG